MKTLKLKYCGSNNFGDALNPYVFRDLFGVEVVQASVRTASVLGIGSILDSVMKPNWQMLKYVWTRRINGPLRVFTSGFMFGCHERNISFVRDLEIIGLRGNKTKQLLESYTGQKHDCVLGDGAFLALYMVPSRPVSKYRVSVIPHVCHYPDARLNFLKESNRHVNIIDLTRDPMDVLRDIIASDFVFSSSLHGLILADTFGVPNQRIGIDVLPGGDFKFEDYHSVFQGEALPTLSLDKLVDEFEMAVESLSQNYVDRRREIAGFAQNILAAFPEGLLEV